MGTHPIFESDFDCLTVLVVQSVTSISNQICFNENTFNQQKIKIKKILHDNILKEGLHQRGKSVCFQLPNYSVRGRRKIQSTNKLIHRLPNLFHSKRKEFYQSVLSFYDNIANKNC